VLDLDSGVSIMAGPLACESPPDTDGFSVAPTDALRVNLGAALRF
jgi:hypothetical protein